jgi:hypothetical protein
MCDALSLQALMFVFGLLHLTLGGSRGSAA